MATLCWSTITSTIITIEASEYLENPISRLAAPKTGRFRVPVDTAMPRDGEAEPRMKFLMTHFARDRRWFLGSAIGMATLGVRAFAHADSSMKAAVIGDTARGRYGHSLEKVFSDRPGIEVVAVADPAEAGRKKVRKAIGALRGYADYCEMLDRERPNMVVVSPRWTEERHAMVTTALAAGAHVLCEKPFTHSLEEADDMLAQAKHARRKLAVCLPIRMSPATVHLKRRIKDGMIGELQSIRASGKADHRAGGEDLLVHGAHIFDLLRLFAGEATEVRARIRQDGRDITRADVRAGVYDKQIGPVAGDDVEAWFNMSTGVEVHYTSRRENPPPAGAYSLEFVGSKGSVRMALGYDPKITVRLDDQWRPLPDNPAEKLSKEARGRDGANARVVDDWLSAIAEDREPECSGTCGMKFVEMVHAVYAAALLRQTVKLPLKDRRHPLLAK